MLDKGFENDIRSIIEKTAPIEKRQTLMCKFNPTILAVQASLNCDENSQRDLARIGAKASQHIPARSCPRNSRERRTPGQQPRRARSVHTFSMSIDILMRLSCSR